ncbi:unnamed protein product [Prorocentrum cordatum]|uniref:Reverse transcriptase domain-containing protein n=1 Tax=Prorocentrum cordatum TaxID=2364126 RepID=A0ABN9T228_9DINO|nr:unnamed protein product [Polarella glacialis]
MAPPPGRRDGSCLRGPGGAAPAALLLARGALAAGRGMKAGELVPFGYHNLFVLVLLVLTCMWAAKVGSQLLALYQVHVRLAANAPLALDQMSIYAKVPRHVLSAHLSPESLEAAALHPSARRPERASTGAAGSVTLYWGVPAPAMPLSPRTWTFCAGPSDASEPEDLGALRRCNSDFSKVSRNLKERAISDVDALPCLWLRGILSASRTHVEEPPDDPLGDQYADAGSLQGRGWLLVGGDASGGEHSVNAKLRQTINRGETQALLAALVDLQCLGVGITYVTEALRGAPHLLSTAVVKIESHLDQEVAEARGVPQNWYAANQIADELAGDWASRFQVPSSTVTSLEMAEAIGSTVRTHLTMAFLKASEAEPRRIKPTRAGHRGFKVKLALSEHELSGRVGSSFHCKGCGCSANGPRMEAFLPRHATKAFCKPCGEHLGHYGVQTRRKLACGVLPKAEACCGDVAVPLIYLRLTCAASLASASGGVVENASETIWTFRKNYLDGFELTIPKGPRMLRLKPLRDGDTNKQITVMGVIRSELESVGKSTPHLAGWSVDSSVGNGIAFVSNDYTGDALKMYCVQTPSSVFVQPRVIAFACHFKQIGTESKQDDSVSKAQVTRETDTTPKVGEVHSSYGSRSTFGPPSIHGSDDIENYIYFLCIEVFDTTDRLAEILRLARAARVAIIRLQSTLPELATPWTTEGYRVIPTPRTTRSSRDGCLIAFNLKFFSLSELRVTHEWMSGRLQGTRLTRRCPRKRDIYILNGYAPLNEVSHRRIEADHHERAVAHKALQTQFWDTCRAALRQIPKRLALIFNLDANAAMSPSLPNVGFAGQRRRYAATNTNGSRLLELFQDYHMMALNTFGKSSRQNGAWKHTVGKGWTTIDYICTRLAGSYGRHAAPLQQRPVSLGGYRDHRPVEAYVHAGLRARRQPEEKPLRWNRDAMVADLHALEDPDAPPPQRVLQMRTTLAQMMTDSGLTNHWWMTCGEHAIIEAAAPHYVPAPTQTTRPKLTDNTLALIETKHTIQRRMAMIADPACARFIEPQTLCDEAAKAAAKAARSERRRRLAETAAEAEAADANMNLRKLHSVVRRLAPKPTAPVITVTSPATATVCMDAEEETHVRTKALCDIFDGTLINMDKHGGDGKNARDHYRAINLINHIGKVFMNVTVMPSLRNLASKPSTAQFGALAGRSTRDALAVVAEVIRRFRLHGRASKLGSAIPGMLVAALIDLEKAFDLIDRDEIWTALEALAQSREARLAVGGLREGTCYIARDIRANRPIKKLSIPRGVRQGSVDGPLLFIAVYDLLASKPEQSRARAEFPEISVLFDPELKQIRHQDALLGEGEEERMVVSPIKFVDDLIALTIVENFEAGSRFLTFLKAEFTKGKTKVNDTKTEMLIVATGEQSKSRKATIRAKQTNIHMHETPVHATPSVKYLGAKQRDDGTMVEERLCTRAMFGPISEVTEPKRGAEALAAPPSEAASSTDGAPNGKLHNFMCRMLLQHEAVRQSAARDDNFTLALKEGAKIEVALEQGYQHFVEVGKKAVPNDPENVKQAIGLGPFATEALEGMGVLLRWGPLVQGEETVVKSTRCFKVTLAEGGENQVRWIWACNHRVDLRSALAVLRINSGLSAANIMLGHDRRPRSKAAKQLEQLAFKGGARTGEKGGAKKPNRK